MKRLSQKVRLLDFIYQHWHSNTEIINAGIQNHTGRLSELRQDGYEIKKRRIEGGLWEYLFTGWRVENGNRVFVSLDSLVPGGQFRTRNISQRLAIQATPPTEATIGESGDLPLRRHISSSRHSRLPLVCASGNAQATEEQKGLFHE